VVLARLDRILPRLAPRGRPDLFSRVLFMPIGGCGSILQPSPGEYIAGTSEEYLDPTAGSTVSKRANWPPLTASPTNGTRPGHGIYSIDFLDGRPPSRQLYSCPPHRAARPNGARLWGHLRCQAIIKRPRQRRCVSSVPSPDLQRSGSARKQARSPTCCACSSTNCAFTGRSRPEVRTRGP
jgi:hypothetical protein